MICSHCQFENLESAIFCSGCGKMLPHVAQSYTRLQQFLLVVKKNKRILIATSTIILLITMTVIYFVTRPSTLELVTTAYETRQVEQFHQYKLELSKKEVETFEQQLILDANEVLTLFKSDSIFHKDAINRLEAISDYVIVTTEIDLITQQVEQLNQSREAYLQGKNWVETKEWDNARDAFSKVISDDTENFDNAQRYLESITRWQLQDIAAQANEFLVAKEFDKAIAEIESGLLIDPQNEILLNLMAAVEFAMTSPEENSDSSQTLSDLLESGLNALTDNINSFFDNLIFWD